MTPLSTERGKRIRPQLSNARATRIGRELGARALSFWSGVDLAPSSDSLPWRDEGVRRTYEIVRGEGLEPSFEPEPGMAIEALAHCDALVQRLGVDASRLTLDVGLRYATGDDDSVELCRRHAPRCALRRTVGRSASNSLARAMMHRAWWLPARGSSAM